MSSIAPKTQPRSGLDGNLFAFLIVGLATLFGAGVRFFQVVFSDFPLNDGGMFYTMTQDLMRNHYTLPVYTSYNLANIPFAYPPLMFYSTVVLSKLTNLSVFEIFRTLPAVISVLTIPAAYLLARVVLGSQRKAAFTALVFALIPQSFLWLIAGGGITRAPGLLFLLLALHQAFLMYRDRRNIYVFTTGLFTALTLLCHPQMGWSAAYSVGLFFLFFGRNREGLLRSMGAAVLTLLISAPWWLSVIHLQNGIAPLLMANQTGSLATRLENLGLLLLGFSFSEQSFWGFLGLIGIVKCVADSKWFLPLWVAAIYFIDPRLPIVFAMVPLAMLVAIMIDQILLPIVEKTARGVNKSTASNAKFTWLATTTLLFLFLFSTGVVSALNISILRVSTGHREAMAWVAKNTEPDSRFLMITARRWYNDNIGEWFPTLAERHSDTTEQGLEWLPSFNDRLKAYEALQACATADITCVEDWSHEHNEAFSHIYIYSGTFSDFRLRKSLLESNRYQLIYDAPDAAIFRKTKSQQP